MRLTKQNIPNYLTYARIVGILPVCILMTLHAPWATWGAAILYALAAFTDWLDGYLSRKWNVVSEIGRFLDPIADKLLIAAVIVLLVANGTIAGIMLACPVLILLREMFISGLREYLGPKKVIIPVTMMAKLKTTMQLVACGILMLEPVSGLIIYILGQGLLVMATVLTVGSGWQYWQQTARYFKSDDEHKSEAV